MNKEDPPQQRHVILAVDDDPSVLEVLHLAFAGRYELLTAQSVLEAEPLLRNRQVEVLICDDNMPGETGLMFMARIHNEFPFTRRILLTGNIDPDVLIYAINEAVLYRFVSKPFNLHELEKLVADGVAAHAEAKATGLAARENERLKNELGRRSEPAAKPNALHREIGRWGSLLMAGLFVLGTLFAVGVVLILVLYWLKSFLGIDFFEDMHFKDLFG
ncbi:MAG: response regulator [Verrucomicrobiota bacterium]